jgi:hypothetical protein
MSQVYVVRWEKLRIGNEKSAFRKVATAQHATDRSDYRPFEVMLHFSGKCINQGLGASRGGLDTDLVIPDFHKLCLSEQFCFSIDVTVAV